MSKRINYKKELFNTYDAVKDSIRVYSQDGSQYGYVIGVGPTYTGEAGYSTRLRVVWPNGRTTLCSVKGMKTYYRKHYKIL